MCGIAGVSGLTDEAIIKQMMSKLMHRGPDHCAYESIGNIHLAHTRLSILDLSTLSNQPLWDKKKKACIVFNGEIYNYDSLRQDLINDGFIMNSAGDAEVILNLYLRDGSACLDQLRGMFAFAIWDVEKHQLFVARDGFGIKPLYYIENAEGFFFASEMKALLTIPYLTKELNYNAILRSIVFLWSPGPETVLKQIRKLEPGHYLIVRDHQIIHQQTFWSWPKYQPEPLQVEQAGERIKDALQKSITEQLVADVPVGAFLSGGLDSSLIVALAKQAGVEEFECMTIRAADNSDINDGFVDDLPYAQAVAEYLNVQLNIVDVKPDIIKSLSLMLYHLDEPQADLAPLNVMLICEQAKKKGIKVLLSGAGGDDIFSGYRRHHAIKLEQYWIYMPKILRRMLQNMAIKLPKNNPLFRRISKLFAYIDLPDNERLLSYFYWLDPKQARSLFTQENKDKIDRDPMDFILKNLAKSEGSNQLEKMLHLEQHYFLVDHNLNYTDKMSMAHGVEVRVPFLDQRVVEIASKINTKLKHQYNHGKWILKKTAEEYLPKAIIYRPKSGFGVPLRNWLKNDLKPLVDEIMSEDSIKKRGLFDFKAVSELIQKNNSGKEDYTYPVFALMCIELWCRIFLDEPKHKRN